MPFWRSERPRRPIVPRRRSEEDEVHADLLEDQFEIAAGVSSATIRPNSKNGEDSPYRKKIFRVGYARGHGYQDSESHAHIGPFLPSRLLLLRESQEHAPAHCLETLAGRRELGLLPGDLLQAPDDPITIRGIELDQACSPAGLGTATRIARFSERLGRAS
jgi:hypothetical protein